MDGSDTSWYVELSGAPLPARAVVLTPGLTSCSQVLFKRKPVVIPPPKEVKEKNVQVGSTAFRPFPSFNRVVVADEVC